MPVRVVDRGANDLLRRMREAAAGTRVKVGVIGSEAAEQHQDGPLTVAAVASFHEFGLGVPERSFIRAYVDERDGELRARLRGIGEAVVKQKKDVRIGLEQFGQIVVGEIQERIVAGIEPELAEETKKRKGNKDTPLILTGQLKSSITYLVEPGGAEGTS